MRRDTRALLEDILRAATRIQAYVAGKTLADFNRDEQLRDAVYFQFIVIGEALGALRQHAEGVYDRISENHRIVGFRNQIVHGYFALSDNITWRTIETKLRTLIDEVRSLQKEA